MDCVVWGGRYAIYEELASGGMATVYLAARLGPPSDVPPVVALKKLADQFAKQPEFVAMFLDEAHLAARIRHPNVVTTYEFLRTDEGLGIVMDLVIGESFMALTRGHDTGGTIPPFSVTTAIVLDALAGLHAAHETTDDSGNSLNLVHRDISPHNVLVGLDGVSRVIDFGIAKAAGRLQTTDVGVLKGKFSYMSPEQIHGRTLDRRTDVYAAGLVLWEALTGKKLFRGKTNEELLVARTSSSAPIPAPSAINPSAPKALDDVVLHALAADPSERFGTAEALAAALRDAHEVGTRSDVAAWVRGRSGHRLDQIVKMRERIAESLASTLAGPSLRAPVAAVTAPSMARQAPIIDIPAEVPDLALDRVSSVPASAPRSLPQMAPSATIPSLIPASSPRRFGGDLDLAPSDPQGALALELEAGPSRPSRTTAPRAPVSRRSAPVREVRAASGSRLLVGLLTVGLVVALAGGVVLRAPAMLKARVQEDAASYGVTLTVDRAELASGGIRLLGVKAALAGVSGVRLVAAEADVALGHGATPERVTLAGYDLSIAASPAELAAQFATWSKAHHPPFAIEGRAGHALWLPPSIPSMSLEALDVSLDGQPSDGVVTLDTPSLLLNVPRGHAGPWHAHLDVAPTETRARLSFDPSLPEAGPAATVITRPAEGLTASLEIPRGSTFKIGVPAALFGITADVSLEAAVRAHRSPSGDLVTAEGQIGLYGLPIAAGKGAHVPVDLIASGSVAGNPHDPLTLVGGKLVVGKVTTPVNGAVTLAPDGIRVQIDRPPGHGTSAALVVDTRDWTAPIGAPSPAASAEAHGVK